MLETAELVQVAIHASSIIYPPHAKPLNCKKDSYTGCRLSLIRGELQKRPSLYRVEKILLSQ